MEEITKINKFKTDTDKDGKKFIYFIMTATVILLISGIIIDIFKNI